MKIGQTAMSIFRASSLLALTFSLLVNSCGDKERAVPSRIGQTETLSLVDEITTDYPKELESITKSPIPEEDIPFSLSLYVDQSQSMRGYIPPQGGNAFYDGSNFVALLRALGNQGELNRLTNAKSFGNGLPPGAPAETLPRVVDLMKPDQKDYNLLNNDYAVQIEEILEKSAPNEISLILTDGVQSYEDTSGGSLMGATARTLKKWIARGGYVETLLSTAPFKGKYFSEELRASGREYTLNVSVPNRPFVVFVLIPDGRLLRQWDAFKRRDRLKDIEFVTYRLPQSVEQSTMPEALPAMVDLSMDDSEKLGLLKRPNKPYGRLDHLVADAPWSKDLYSAKIFRADLSDSTGKSIPRVPIFITISAPPDSVGSFGQKEFAKFRPTLSVYERIPVPAEPVSASGGGSRPQNGNENILDRAQKSIGEEKASSMTKVSPTKNWKQMASLNLREENFGLQPTASGSGGSAKLALCQMVPWDGERDLLCVLRMEAVATPVEPPRFEQYSTTNDSSTSELSKVYNLATLMEQLAKNEVKTARPTGFILHLRSAK